MNQNLALLLAAQTELANVINKAMSSDDGIQIRAAATRVAELQKFFADNKAEIIDAAISTDFLKANLIAMSKANSEAWEKEQVEALSLAEKTPAKLAQIAERAAGMRSAYTRFSHFRKLYRCHNEMPAVWREFCAMPAEWNKRMEWLVRTVDAVNAEQKLNAASAVLVAASEVVEDGKVIAKLSDDEARAQVAKLNDAAKRIKDRANAEPTAIASDCAKLIAKRGGDVKQVIAALIATAYGDGFSVVSDDVIKRLRAKVA